MPHLKVPRLCEPDNCGSASHLVHFAVEDVPNPVRACNVYTPERDKLTLIITPVCAFTLVVWTQMCGGKSLK